jgi:hypothetical protein
MENSINVSVRDIKEKKVKIKNLDFDDLFDSDNEPDLIFNVDHFSSSDNSIRLLECKNCRLGSDLYLFIYDDKQKIFTVNETTTIDVSNKKKKIKLIGWDSRVSISLCNGKIKERETR